MALKGSQENSGVISIIELCADGLIMAGGSILFGTAFDGTNAKIPTQQFKVSPKFHLLKTNCKFTKVVKRAAA